MFCAGFYRPRQIQFQPGTETEDVGRRTDGKALELERRDVAPRQQEERPVLPLETDTRQGHGDAEVRG